MFRYDYIIAGAGAAGLNLLDAILKSSLRDKSILLIDRSEKLKNDRTWSFWETGENPLEDLVYRAWDIAEVHSDEHSLILPLAPYRYKMIRGIDLYDHGRKLVAKHANVNFQIANIQSLEETDEAVLVHTDEGVFAASQLFDCSYRRADLQQNNQYRWLWQHFKGWRIKTEHDVFKTDQFNMMDFRVPQEGETRFIYVLPFAPNEALVEFTIFGRTPWESEVYDDHLKKSIAQVIGDGSYEILEEELGAIPMTNQPPFYPSFNKIIPLGSLAGQTKASTGYTFKRIQQQCQYIVRQLEQGRQPKLKIGDSRYRLFDSILLNVIDSQKVPAPQVFTELFRKHPTERVLRFLDEESNRSEDLAIMRKSPTLPFTKAFFEEVFKAR